jgi:anaerobic ribonucleoside-triphosphate reductase activating protein
MLIHGLVSDSRVNGPGLRAVIYFQGCTLGCRDCWNPETHTFAGEERTSAEVANWIVSAHQERLLDGLTFSGGEPMHQADALLALIKMLRARIPGLSFGMYSGYSEPELSSGLYRCRSNLTQREKREIWRRIQIHLDFGVLGRYAAGRPSTLALRSSSNQKLTLFSERYEERDFAPQEVEIHIDPQGLVQVTGFPTAGVPA